MGEFLTTISPVDGSVYVERPFHTPAEIEQALETASSAHASWRSTSLAERVSLLQKFTNLAVAEEDAIAMELTMQMGRPIAHGKGECAGFRQRGERMLELASEALADSMLPSKDGFERFIRRESLGVVLVLAPWNYPWLTVVNAIIPALAAGNVVLLKHAEQTPLVAERLSAAAKKAGIPEGVFQHIHMTHEQTAKTIGDSRVDFVCFTGSVAGGHAVQMAASSRFTGVSLELGGKDPAYVRADSDIEYAAANLVEGAFYNAGQSCCGVERIYVHRSVHDEFIDAYRTEIERLVLGDPRNEDTTLGPVVRARNAENIEAQIQDAIRQGARSVIDRKAFHAKELGPAYLAPDVLVSATHEMSIMTEETFGPVVGIASVRDDNEAILLMNDSAYGLTASIWTKDHERAKALGDRLVTGTVFSNRCDYLDPDLAWVGVKDSGRGCSLSILGFLQLTRPKSFHLRQWRSESREL